MIDSREERQRMRRTKMMISRGCCFVLVEIRFLISDGHIEIGHGSFSLEKMVPFYYEREKKCAHAHISKSARRAFRVAC